MEVLRMISSSTPRNSQMRTCAEVVEEDDERAEELGELVAPDVAHDGGVVAVAGEVLAPEQQRAAELVERAEEEEDRDGEHVAQPAHRVGQRDYACPDDRLYDDGHRQHEVCVAGCVLALLAGMRLETTDPSSFSSPLSS